MKTNRLWRRAAIALVLSLIALISAEISYSPPDANAIPEPVAGPMSLSDDMLRTDRQVFIKQCHQCHPGGEAGLGPAINNKPLPRFLIRFQIRNGFGAMPAFSEEQISPNDLAALLDYLSALKKHG